MVTSGNDKQTLVRVNTVRTDLSLMDPIVSFLMDETLPNDKAKVEKAQRKAP